MLVAVAVAPWPLGYFDAVYGVISLLLGAGMMWLAINVYRHREGSPALRATRRLFAFSILYLFALFATLLLEVVVRAVAPAIGAIASRSGRGRMGREWTTSRSQMESSSPRRRRRSRRQRSIAIALALGVLVVLFFAVTMVKGPGVLVRPM